MSKTGTIPVSEMMSDTVVKTKYDNFTGNTPPKCFSVRLRWTFHSCSFVLFHSLSCYYICIPPCLRASPWIPPWIPGCEPIEDDSHQIVPVLVFPILASMRLPLFKIWLCQISLSYIIKSVICSMSILYHGCRKNGLGTKIINLI